MLEPVHSMRGKLPSLHRIGKTKCIDEDEPPPIHDLSFDPVPFAVLEENRFDVSDAEETLRALRRAFRIVCPGRHACKRSFDHSGLNITHCRDGVGLGKYYLQLQKIMEKRAWLEFTHDWMYRVKSTLLFIQELESMVYTEYCTLYDIMHNNQLPQDIESKLCGLNSICEDLRVHSNHWNSIQQRIRTQQWMQPLLSSVYSELKMLKKVFFQLQDATIWWIHKLIEIGIVVFSHSQMSHVSNEVFWSVARGLEDFNSIVTSAKLNAFHDNEGILFKDPNLMAMWNSIMINSKFHNLSSLVTISPISLNHILNCFANQRSRYATFDTHRFLTKSDEFIDNLDIGALPGFVWNDLSANILSSVSSDSFEQQTQTGNGSASLSTVILNVNPLKAPDLSVLMSPLTDFVRREQDFAEKFLSVICNSTNFLRLDNTNNSSIKDSKNINVNRLTARRFSGTPVLSRTDSRRKTVSWGDTANSSIKSQLVNTYLENIWENFGRNFEHLIYEPAWNGERSLMRTDIGSLFLVNDALVLMLCRMIYHGIVKDLFPSGSVIPLQVLAQKIHTIAAIGCWDNCVCKVEGLRTVDKCYPCPLGNGDYSTKTGLLLKDTYQPLLSALENCIQSLNSTGPESSLQKSVVDPTRILSLFTRLQTTACIALSWCYSKTHEFLASWSIGSFILVTQTDLKILSDETKRAVCIAQTLCTNLSLYNSLHNAYVHSALTEVYHELEDINSQLQSLSGSVMKLFSENCGKISKQFFQNNMPGGKIWRSKSVGRFNDYTIEQQDYIEHALETILEPVVEGVSKLRVTSQLSVISIATVAMCEAWTDFILKEKIKFSLHGAHQLGADFNFVRTWLSSAIRNNEVRQSITQLSVFSYLNGIVLLLQRQPKKRASARFTDTCANDDISSDTADSCNTESNHRGANCESSTETEVRNNEKDICSVSNTDDWLALRVCGGTRSWKFPSCFNIQREDT